MKHQKDQKLIRPFFAIPEVIKELKAGLDHLPILMLDGQIISSGIYLSRSELAEKPGITLTAEHAVQITPVTIVCASKTSCG